MFSNDVAYGRIRIFLALLLAGAACLYVTLSSCGTEVGTPPGGGGASAVSVLTYHNDVARTGQNLHETILTHANVNSASFGRIGFMTTSTNGRVDAQPLFVPDLQVGGVSHNVVFAVTEQDLVYAFDADSFAGLWQVSLLLPGESPADSRGCDDLAQVGITGTPVIDPHAGPHGTIFVVAQSTDGSNYFNRLHALDLATGAERPGSPVTIQPTYPNSFGGTNTFETQTIKDRAALLLHDGVIYTAWGSFCDIDFYQGWVIAYNESTLQQAGVLNITPNGTVPNGGQGGLWMSGGGIAVDSSGFLYFTAGNGTFDTTLNGSGFPINSNFGNAFIKASTSGGSMTIVDYFNMHDTISQSGQDHDFGSGGVLILPDLRDSSGKTVHLALAAGKDGNLFVVNRDSLGKFDPSNDNAVYQKIDGVDSRASFGTPAYFNGTVYVHGEFEAGQNERHLNAFPIANGRLATTPSSSTQAEFNFPGTIPSISANGTTPGTAIVWAVHTDIFSGTNAGVLHAYKAEDLGQELYNSDQAGSRDQFTGTHFSAPTITNGKVYVGTQNGVMVFGLLH